MAEKVQMAEYGAYTGENSNILENVYQTRETISFDEEKRMMDLLISGAGIIAAAIPMAVAALLIKAEDGGPVFYSVNRIGKNGVPFKMYKFRTMVENAEKLEDFLTPEELEEYKKNYKLEHDPRLTKIGSILRKTSIDELPQLMNVWNGSMSLIGPRPILQEETELYGMQRDRLLSVKPGLTGYWQAYGRSNVSYEDGKRQQMELYYVDNRSTKLDIRIFFKTIQAVLLRDGAR